MSYLPQIAALAGVFLISCISPGPDFLTVTSSAVEHRTAGLGSALGVACGHLIWSSLALFGLGSLLAEVAWLYTIVRFAGAAYLIYLGGKMLWGARLPAAEVVVGQSVSLSLTEAMRRGFLVNMTNPKAVAFFGSLFVSLLPVDAPLSVNMATVAVVGLVSISWFGTLALMFSHPTVRRQYQRTRRVVDGVTGALLLGLGVRLAVSR